MFQTPSVRVQLSISQRDASDARRVQVVQRLVPDHHPHFGQRLHRHRHPRPPLLRVWRARALPGRSESGYQRPPGT